MAGGTAAGTQQTVLWGSADQSAVAAHSSALQKTVSTAGEEGREKAGERAIREIWGGKEEWISSWMER